MMHDPLEKFIVSNREGMDAVEPSDRVWKAIESKTKKASVVPFYRSENSSAKWLAAASVVLAIGIAAIFYLPKEHKKTTAADQIEMQYSSLIEIKRVELKSIEKENPELYKEFWSDSERLEEEFMQLKTQAKNDVNTDRVLQAMVQNLRLQMDLLNRQINIIRQIKHLKNENNHQSI